MIPKPQKPLRGTPACREHMGLVAQLPCVVCGRYAVQVHHVIMDRFSQSRASDMETIPLCADDHRDLHARPERWRQRNGPDHGFLPQVAAQIETIRRNTI